jgi:hypothetical protein
MDTLTAVVNKLGHPVRSTRGVWSWKTGENVTLALWSDLIVNNGQEYHNANEGSDGGPGSQADARRRKHVAYALEHLQAKVSSAIVTRNPNTTADAIKTVEVGPEWRVTWFNHRTGAFHLERITFANFRK